MDYIYGILLVLLPCYVVGWFVSFVIFLVGSIRSRLQIAIAHAYAILLLLLAMQILGNESASILMVFCFLDLLAIALFLFLYVRGLQKKNNTPLTKAVHRFINTNED